MKDFNTIKNENNNKRIKSIISSKGLSKINKEYLNNYILILKRKNVSKNTIKSYLHCLKEFGLFIKKDFNKAIKKDIELFSDKLQDSLKESTIHNYKLVLKDVYTNLIKKPSVISELTFNKRNGKTKLPEELITPEEIKKIVQVASNLRDKALVFALYESGCRKGEILSLKNKHLTFDQYGAVLIVTGKTGMRRIRLIDSVPDLIKWKNAHPNRDDPESPLWITIGAWKERAFGEDGLKRMLNILSERAKVKKKIYPHLLRHSRLTEVAKFMSEQELKVYAGWTAGSNMAVTYIHLSGKDIDKKILENAGVELSSKDKKEKKKQELKPLECPRCQKINSASAKFCDGCSMALDLKTAVEMDNFIKKKSENAKRLVNVLNKNRERKVEDILLEIRDALSQ